MGRTFRLIEEAVRLHQQGKSVVIVVERYSDLAMARIQAGVKIPVISTEAPYWNWDTMQCRGFPPGTEFLVDHFAIEKRYGHLIKEFHRFDAPDSPAPDIASLELDAARYRWLRAQHWSDNTLAVLAIPKEAVKLGSDAPSGERLDQFIDYFLWQWDYKAERTS
jgi:hypothetical protein